MGAGCNVVAGFPGNRDQSPFDGVLVLPVAASGADQPPAVFLDDADDLADFQTVNHVLSKATFVPFTTA